MKNKGKSSIFLFCQYFPYKGGEQFLFNEAEYYPSDIRVNVFTEHPHTNEIIQLSSNFLIHNVVFKDIPTVRQVVKFYWKIIIVVFVTEILKSPHRIKYVRNFKTHFYLLLGYLQKAIVIDKMIPTNENITLYSYWFDEWAIIIHLVKKIRKGKIKIICRAHAYDFDEAQVASSYHPFRSFDLKGFNNIISVSEYGKKYIQAKYNFKEVLVDKIGVREKGNNPYKICTVKTIVSCSSLIPLKRVNLIIELLKRMSLEIKWIHYGNGPLESEILEQAKLLPPKIKFAYKGFVENREIVDFYGHNSIDLFINVSTLEGIPVSLMEAISFGIPIIGCNICGVPEIVNENTGLLLEKDFELQSTAIRIEKFIEEKCTDIKFREGVKKYWKNNFNADYIYPQFIQKYLLN